MQNNHFMSENERMEKYEIIIKLNNLTEKYNIRLTKKYTIDDDLSIMKCELEYHQANLEKIRIINLFRDYIKIAKIYMQLHLNQVQQIMDIVINNYNNMLPDKKIVFFDKIVDKFYHNSIQSEKI